MALASPFISPLIDLVRLALAPPFLLPPPVFLRSLVFLFSPNFWQLVLVPYFFCPPFGLPVASNLLAANATSATGPFAIFRLGPLTPICPMPFFSDNCHTTPIFLSLRQVRYNPLSLKDDYTFQRFVSLLGIYKK